ncbi:Cyclic nucleotide-binding domain protein [Pseudovibrio axinellae]|uniref:Cyclic nucleotide-binding domain protein n=1 Tax=Pseudovibrio axinellae TaxID=989403 RepID=A0A165WA65_9HYPH|nr:Crp/Fnr family transcriptional regulator [Pseudovibrio axinellae]KZL16274.1 Cyclic nucleotide-binding domain protein [Pseudovibrio axinellae]SER78654.1 Cyclic nucleotide-binding domain-containing protein [Pseudovibrio axinellae]
MVDIKNIHRLLGENPFFNGISEEHLELISGCGRLAHFKAGEFLLREGEVADTFHLVRTGKISIESNSPARGPLSISGVLSGGIIGFDWLFPPHRHSFDSLAITSVSTVALDGECLRGKAEADHELGYQLMKRFSQVMHDRLQATQLQLLDIYSTGRETDAS